MTKMNLISLALIANITLSLAAPVVGETPAQPEVHTDKHYRLNPVVVTDDTIITLEVVEAQVKALTQMLWDEADDRMARDFAVYECISEIALMLGGVSSKFCFHAPRYLLDVKQAIYDLPFGDRVFTDLLGSIFTQRTRADGSTISSRFINLPGGIGLLTTYRYPQYDAVSHTLSTWNPNKMGEYRALRAETTKWNGHRFPATQPDAFLKEEVMQHPEYL